MRKNLCVLLTNNEFIANRRIMPITKKEVEHIAKLARVELTDTEVAKYEKELSAVLGFVDKLSEVDTENIAPLTGGTDLVNVMREDVRTAANSETNSREQLELAAELVKAAPEYEGGFVKVKKVFE